MKNEEAIVIIMLTLVLITSVIGNIKKHDKIISNQQQQIETLTKKVDSLIVVQKIKR